MDAALTASVPPVPSQVSAQLSVDCRCELGEGILWDDREQALLWTDIQAARLWRHYPSSGATQSWSLPDRLGSIALCASGRLLLGLAKGLYLADLRGSESNERLAVQLLVTIDEHPTLRLNDGRIDRHGNFVFGTLNEAADRRPIGRFYQYSARHGLRTLDLGGVAIPNSLAFTLDGRALYFCDTCRGEIMICDYDAERARTATPRVFVCHGRDGSIEHEVAVPTTNPSCPAFGGPQLDRLYVTTARENMSAAQLEREPHAGGVFCAQIAGAAGLPEQRFADL
jgi:L-arabinonolactonase